MAFDIQQCIKVQQICREMKCKITLGVNHSQARSNHACIDDAAVQCTCVLRLTALTISEFLILLNSLDNLLKSVVLSAYTDSATPPPINPTEKKILKMMSYFSEEKQ